MNSDRLFDAWRGLVSWEHTQLLLAVLFYFLIAWIAARLLPGVVSRAMLAMAEGTQQRPLSTQRRKTIQRLGRDLTRLVVYALAAIASLALFVDSRGLFTFLGLFSAAFGLGARPLVSDYMSGMIYLFEDTYAIGDKVDVLGIEGIVEDIRLRTTIVRGTSGDLYYIPNGEIRAVRNYARGVYSAAGLSLQVDVAKLDEVLALLDGCVVTAQRRIPELIEAPRVVIGDATIGDKAEIKLVAKAGYGHGPEARRHLLHLVQEALGTLATHVSE